MGDEYSECSRKYSRIVVQDNNGPKKYIAETLDRKIGYK